MAREAAKQARRAWVPVVRPLATTADLVGGATFVLHEEATLALSTVDLPDAGDIVLVVGSRNSSNTNRLVDVALSHGRPAYRVDGADELVHDWFGPNQTVVVTARASAPESRVAECVEFLEQHFAAIVEERGTRQEHFEFPLPAEVR